MVNDKIMAEPVMVKEVIEMDVPSTDEKVYCSTSIPESKYPESVHGQQQVVMIPTEQGSLPLADIPMYDGTLNLHTSAPFYHIVPSSYYFQQTTHPYAPTLPATAAAAHQAGPSQQPIGQHYAPPTTVMLVQMPTNYQESVSTGVRQHAPIQNVAATPANFNYHQMPVEYAPTIAPAAVVPAQPVLQQQQQQPQQQQQQQAAPQQTNAGASYWRQLPYRSNARWNFCQFCLNNKEPEEFYRSHRLQDSERRVTCPVLRAYNCPICNNGGGDWAHTKSYCPQLMNRNVMQTGGRRVHTGQQHNMRSRSGHRQRTHTQTVEQNS